jgi:hypothetical protein
MLSKQERSQAVAILDKHGLLHLEQLLARDTNIQVILIESIPRKGVPKRKEI